MGLFKKIKKVVSHTVSHPVSTVKSAVHTAIQNPVRSGMAITSGGLSEVVRQAPVVGSSFKKIQAIAGQGYVAAANVYTGGLYGQGSALADSFVKPKSGGDNMAFNLGGFLGQVGSILGGSSIPGFQTAGQLATLGSAFVPQPAAQQLPYYGPPMQAQPVMAPAMQAAVVAGRVGAVVGRSFFNRFPNLATAIQALRNQGKNVNRAKLYSAMKRFGPELLVSGGILTAAAVSELMVAGPGTRRMNPANSRALRRAAGRIRSFHKLCQHTDLLKTRHRRPCK